MTPVDSFGTAIPRHESLAAIGEGRRTPPRGGTQERNPDEPRKAAEALPVEFEPRDARCVLEDVVLSGETLRQVSSLIAKIERHRTLYETWGLNKIEPAGKRLAFNLYGPPGTGKTMLAEALAGRFGRKIIEVSYAEIESKYVGDTPKNIVAVFKEAARSGAVLFFDEADSILGKRMTAVTQAADHGVNVSRAVMLKQLDGFDGIVMFATNLAQNFDQAFVRRILYHIEIGLPDVDCLRRLWTYLIPNTVPGKEALDLSALAAESLGLAGGDLRNAVIMAASDAVQRDGEAQQLTREDLARAIGAIRKAKTSVGRERRSTGWVDVGSGDALPEPSGAAVQH